LFRNLSHILGSTKLSSLFSVSPAFAIGLTVAVAFILLASNFAIISAQQVTSQPGGTNNGAFATATPPPTTTALRTFQSTNDSFRVQVPQSWIIDDVNNTGPALPEETRLGYEMLAQLCPEEQEIQPTFPNVNSSINTSDCAASQNGVIHVIRYPNLDSGLIQTANNATVYHLQKLQEVGYNNIQIVNSTNITVNLTLSQANQTIATVPAKFVEMIFSTVSAPDEIRRGYFILTATNATSPNLGVTKGYSVFYEDNSNDTTFAAAAPEITRTTATSTGNLASVSLPIPVERVFDSFELIVAPEVEQEIIQQQEAPVGQTGGGTGVDADDCDSSYPDDCIPPPPPDLNCDDVGVTNFRVLSPDSHDFDRDNDGVGCESGSGLPEDSSEDVDDDGSGGDGDTSCHPSYPDTCIPPPPPNLNCDDVSDTNFEVVGSDPHGFDGDNDGIGCESGSGVPDDDDDGNDDGNDDGDEEPEPEPEPEPGDGDTGGGDDGGGDEGGGDDGGGDGDADNEGGGGDGDGGDQESEPESGDGDGGDQESEPESGDGDGGDVDG
jgi:hypothetical protein